MKSYKSYLSLIPTRQNQDLSKTTYKTVSLYLNGEEYKINNNQDILNRLTASPNNHTPIFKPQAINHIMLSRDFDDHCTQNTLDTLYKGFKEAVKQALKDNGYKHDKNAVNSALGCKDLNGFDSMFHGTFGSRIFPYRDFILQQQPFSQNAKLQEYLNPTDKKSTSLIFTKSNEIYAKEIKLHSGILAGIAKINTFVNLRNPTQASIDFSVISNNTQKNLDKVAKIITKVVPQNHIYGINYGTINSAKPHYPYLVSGMQKMFGMDLENDSEKQGKIFVYSGDRPTDPEFALNAHRNGIQSIGILHDVANLVSSPKTLIAKQQMLDYSKEIPIFVLSGSINDTVQDLANLEISICSAIDKHNIDFAKLSEKGIITDATIKTTNLNVA